MIKLKYKNYRIKESNYGVTATQIHTDRVTPDGEEKVKTLVGYYPNIKLAIKAVISHIAINDTISQIEDLQRMQEMYLTLIADFDNKVEKICERLEGETDG